MSAEALARSREAYFRAVEGYVESLRGSYEPFGGPRPAWQRAYERLSPPTRALGPAEAERTLEVWGEELEVEMREACSGLPAAELFFALRLLPPGLLPPHPLRRARTGDTVGALAERRTATYGAQLYGIRAPGDYSAEYGGAMSNAEWERFGEALVTLLKLSNESLALFGCQRMYGLGLELKASSERVLPVKFDERDYLLADSFDRRKHYNYTPFTRSGEFFPEAYDALLWDPYENPTADRLEGGLGLFSAAYMTDYRGRPSYRLSAWPLTLLERFLDQLKPHLIREAWDGLGKEEFLALLAGICALVKERLSNPDRLRAVHESAIVPFQAEEIEGEPLLTRAENYLSSRGHDLANYDLSKASRRFFELALTPAPGGDGSPAPRARLEDPHVRDTRYSDLLRHFGKVYIADLYHADHWLHGPMEFLAERMKGGEEGTEKGNRAEDQVCDYMGRSPRLEVAEALRSPFVKRIMHEGEDLGDLDCPVRIGNTLIVAEVKAYALRYPVESVEREAMKGRWEESQRFLNRVDRKACVVAKHHKGKHYSKHLKGIQRILPVVCRPYPEWIPSCNRHYWLRPPAVNDTGVPRILTPKDLKNLCETSGEEGIVSLAHPHLIEVSR